MEKEPAWVNLRLYLAQDDGLWLISDGHGFHPWLLGVTLEEYRLGFQETVGLLRAGNKPERHLSRFRVDKLPYNLNEELSIDLEQILGSVPKILNYTDKNFDSTYKAIILFAEINVDVSKRFKVAGMEVEWFSMDEIRAADEQDGKINGMDDLHLKELQRLLETK